MILRRIGHKNFLRPRYADQAFIRTKTTFFEANVRKTKLKDPSDTELLGGQNTLSMGISF